MNRSPFGIAAALGAVVALAAPALSAPGITITAPAEGASISRTETPVLTMSGGVNFDTPMPTDLKFNFRRTGCGTDKRLSVEANPGETSGCAENNSHTPLNEVNRLPALWAAADGLPFTVDASRPMRGVLTLTSFQPPVYAGVGQTIVEISASGSSGTNQVPLGSTMFEYLTLPGQLYSTPWSITVPAAADRVDLSGFTLSITVRGIHALHGYIRPSESNVTLPTYSASFNRRVEVAVDGGTFSSTSVTLTPDLDAWSAEVATPSTGAHALRARAVQGAVVSSTASTNITVTP